ncbi:MAG: hypothetical protein HY553_19420 [Elusimicrobia bacterium]|nr:hypothetical protein [Elusimicrobiota bacterium]
MRLYLGEALIHPAAGAADIERALPALKEKPRVALELRRDERTKIRVSYEAEVGWFIDVTDPKALFGWLVPEGGEQAVRSALVDFLSGQPPSFTAMAMPKHPGVQEVVLGDAFEPDCPLCAAMARG